MNKDHKLVNKALKIACKAHADKTDRGGMPYIFHPVLLASKFKDTDLQVVALLHDVIEDSHYTALRLVNDGIPAELVEAVEFLTRTGDMYYETYIDKLQLNALARTVKIADLEHNLDITRVGFFSDTFLNNLRKYKKAHTQLIQYDRIHS